MAAKGKGYKAQAKAEAERAEKAIVAGRALQMQHRAAVQRISELEEALRRANGGVGIETLMAEGEIGSLSTAARMSSARMEGDLIGMDDAAPCPTHLCIWGSSPPVASTPACMRLSSIRIQLNPRGDGRCRGCCWPSRRATAGPYHAGRKRSRAACARQLNDRCGARMCATSGREQSSVPVPSCGAVACLHATTLYV